MLLSVELERKNAHRLLLNKSEQLKTQTEILHCLLSTAQQPLLYEYTCLSYVVPHPKRALPTRGCVKSVRSLFHIER